MTSWPSVSMKGATWTRRFARSRPVISPMRKWKRCQWAGQAAHLMVADVHAAGGDLVEFGLPDVRAVAVDQGDVGPAPATEGVTRRVASSRPRASATMTILRAIAGLGAHQGSPQKGF